MTELLTLYFDKNNERQCLRLVSPYRTLDTLTLFDFINVEYHGGFFKNIFYGEAKQTIFDLLIDGLQDAIENKVVFDESIKKSLGYYQNQYNNNPERKNLKYGKDPDGEGYWVGRRYKLFDSSYTHRSHSWLYNDIEGRIWLEVTPSYPWMYSMEEKGEFVLNFRDWLKNFQPYVVRQISKETAQQWVKQLQDLLSTIEANDKRLTCTGPGCKLCKQEGSELYKQYCKCEKGEEIHRNS